ncbi:PIN-like domain-containing protein [Streptomyces uncialis]|uniref:PIN-like domain-containing protein n=1 Tax=Streptomyces uncialis TaxID=1048205 RepID=UPI002252FD03|nr:PIN-like domain-containing protein [Streptomyces uncialis]MCX4664083.1 PIN-like domain-containing protein [Streptomyces uncialis]
MQGPESELPLIRQYQDWLRADTAGSEPDRSAFFTDALIVLDTNVLLSLYEYTPAAREQVLDALSSVRDRLWLPHQVGLEFVQGRHRVIAERRKALNDAPGNVNRRLGEANKAILAARELVQGLLVKYARDAEASEQLASEISSQAVDTLLGEWKTALIDQVKALKQDHDLAPGSVDTEDPVLPRVAALFGENIADPPSPPVVRQRVTEAVSYRFPNQIPPGFKDAGKGTPLSAAGDYLLWEEVIDRLTMPDGRKRLLFVSADMKDDWYQPAEHGRAARPWPSLMSELRNRTGAELRIETPGHFYRGVDGFLHAEIAAATYDEIDRAAIPPARIEITEEEAPLTPHPPELAEAASKAAGLDGYAAALLDHLFVWWLIGVTVQLGRREPQEDEPPVSIAAAAWSADAEPGWIPGDALRLGEWPYRSSTRIAPWFVRSLGLLPLEQRRAVQRLAAQQLDRAPRAEP